MFRCFKCNKVYRQSRGLARHRRLAHGPEMYHYCRQCRYSDARRDNLRRHYRDMHENHMADLDEIKPEPPRGRDCGRTSTVPWARVAMVNGREWRAEKSGATSPARRAEVRLEDVPQATSEAASGATMETSHEPAVGPEAPTSPTLSLFPMSPLRPDPPADPPAEEPAGSHTGKPRGMLTMMHNGDNGESDDSEDSESMPPLEEIPPAAAEQQKQPQVQKIATIREHTTTVTIVDDEIVCREERSKVYKKRITVDW